MDAIVEAALRKWPNVPACRGWLGLSARGDWYLRDEAAQAAGPFPQSPGSLIRHAGLRDFIGRNYACDASGCWYFQNGPQRVYVELESAPWVWRLVPRDGAIGIEAHTGVPSQFESAWVDELGQLFIATELGLGRVHSQDMHRAGDAVDRGVWRVTETSAAALRERFDYVLSPLAAVR
jgi:Protein of unknown function (DUF2946)